MLNLYKRCFLSIHLIIDLGIHISLFLSWSFVVDSGNELSKEFRKVRGSNTADQCFSAISRHSRSMFFCYIGDPDVISKLCYDHIPPAHKLITICYNRTTSVSIVSVSFALCAASGGLV